MNRVSPALSINQLLVEEILIFKKYSKSSLVSDLEKRRGPIVFYTQRVRSKVRY